MFTYTKRNGLIAAIAMSLLLVPATVQAYHRDRDYEKPDVEVESLKAALHRASQGWYLNIQYEVELEDARPDRFDVLIAFSERGRMLRDGRGRPIELFEGLGRPTDVDDDEFEFKNRLLVTLPRELIHNPKKLKTHVAIIDRYTNRVIDDKTTSVKWKR